ncbi:hypothetical protein O6H91_14G001700 [Diphasiastrum complanatum]|uniref:Uncharacterized protein n=1 Tax=Diphasiastrum complanatum TaxID=34168 RepID=A0ACC2BKU9_DIPCM|nr:hypothetical protein O6H91_14G001700 [Diphasiastrum complanatum]
MEVELALSPKECYIPIKEWSPFFCRGQLEDHGFGHFCHLKPIGFFCHVFSKVLVVMAHPDSFYLLFIADKQCKYLHFPTKCNLVSKQHQNYLVSHCKNDNLLCWVDSRCCQCLKLVICDNKSFCIPIFLYSTWKNPGPLGRFAMSPDL